MTGRSAQLQLGFGAVFGALLLIFWAIPGYVSSPSNVGNIILSPLFWPYTLSGFALLIGIGMILTGWREEPGGEPVNAPLDNPRAGWKRIAGITVILAVTMLLLPLLGMVWTSMLTFAATAFLVRTRHPKTALVCAVLIPLLLYAFFAHVAGVAIPQGEFIRLP